MRPQRTTHRYHSNVTVSDSTLKLAPTRNEGPPGSGADAAHLVAVVETVRTLERHVFRRVRSRDENGERDRRRVEEIIIYLSPITLTTIKCL